MSNKCFMQPLLHVPNVPKSIFTKLEKDLFRWFPASNGQGEECQSQPLIIPLKNSWDLEWVQSFLVFFKNSISTWFWELELGGLQIYLVEESPPPPFPTRFLPLFPDAKKNWMTWNQQATTIQVALELLYCPTYVPTMFFVVHLCVADSPCGVQLETYLPPLLENARKMNKEERKNPFNTKGYNLIRVSLTFDLFRK